MYCSKKNPDQLIPLVDAYDESRIITWRDGKPIRYAEFLSDVLKVSENLPKNKYIINLCEDRYLFMVSFAAVVVNGQTNLLPPGKKPAEIEDIVSEFSDCCYIAEADYPDLNLKKFILSLPSDRQEIPADQLPMIERQHLAVIIFTSGSTGHASKNLKTWRELVEGIKHFQSNMGFAAEKNYTIVATVPPQHMYGLETSILLPMTGAVSVVSERPFYPEDIHETIEGLKGPVVLITTPLQLKACAYSGISWPKIDFVVSSTAPLPVELASQSELSMQTRVMEIYGSTETGAIASRQTSVDEEWQLFEGYHIDAKKNQFSADHLVEPVNLNDHVLMLGDGRFRLMGRKSDLIKIAGKRGSIGDLNNKLRSITGVEDGVFLLPDDEQSVTSRLVALVVAPNLSAKQVSDSLAQLVDPVFLPRPLLKVDALPYTETNKLRKVDLINLYKQARKQ